MRFGTFLLRVNNEEASLEYLKQVCEIGLRQHRINTKIRIIQ